MADQRPTWPVEKVLSTAKSIARILVDDDNRVLAVALTGSGARVGEAIHDIDLVVLTTDAIPACSVRFPFTDWRSYVDPRTDIFSQRLIDFIDKERAEIPVDLILVQAKALWDCLYLQALKGKEIFRDFYLRIFSDPNLPLRLVHCRIGFLNAPIPNGGCVIKHNCSDLRCKPTQSWDDSRKEVLARKAAGTHHPS